MRIFVSIVVLLAMVCCAKVHLPLLQVVAWTGMVVKYAQTVPLSEALEMTFDGDHPLPALPGDPQGASQHHAGNEGPGTPRESGDDHDS